MQMSTMDSKKRLRTRSNDSCGRKKCNQRNLFIAFPPFYYLYFFAIFFLLHHPSHTFSLTLTLFFLYPSFFLNFPVFYFDTLYTLNSDTSTPIHPLRFHILIRSLKAKSSLLKEPLQCPQCNMRHDAFEEENREKQVLVDGSDECSVYVEAMVRERG